MRTFWIVKTNDGRLEVYEDYNEAKRIYNIYDGDDGYAEIIEVVESKKSNFNMVDFVNQTFGGKQ